MMAYRKATAQGAPANRIYYAALGGIPPLDPASGGYIEGEAYEIPGSVASGYVPPPSGFGSNLRQVASHEIAHCMGLQHDVDSDKFGVKVYYYDDGYNTYALGACSEEGPVNSVYPFQPVPAPDGPLEPALGPMTGGDSDFVYGLDTSAIYSGVNPVVSPNAYFDLMSYCGGYPLDRWPSIYTYTNLLHFMTARFSAPVTPTAAPSVLTRSNDSLIIRGSIDLNSNTATFEPFASMLSAGVLPAPPSGDYSLVIYDAKNNVLQNIGFSPVQGIIEEDGSPKGAFIIPVANNPLMYKVELWHGSDLLTSITAPLHGPSVSGITLTSTNGTPFTGSGTFNISWSGTDPDVGAVLTYSIEFSADGGLSWDTLWLDWQNPTFQVNSATLAATKNGLIRITASDGFHVSQPAYSKVFSLAGSAPNLQISQPHDGALFIADDQIVMDVSVEDLQDGSLGGTNVTWSSSIDGVLGTGAELFVSASSLSEGKHSITVTATDSVGLSNSASVSISVLRREQPTVWLQNLGGQISLAWPASVTDYALESCTNLAANIWTAMTNVPSVNGSLQIVPITASSGNQFFRLSLQ